jgi:hypothetical protein
MSQKIKEYIEIRIECKQNSLISCRTIEKREKKKQIVA